MNRAKILLGVAVLLAAILVFQHYKIKSLSRGVERYKENTEVLQSDIERYKTKDSLNGVRVRGLELTIEEFERYRAQDAEIIKTLKQRNRDLESVNNIQSQTIIDLRAMPKDTVIIRDSVPIPAKSVRCGDEWFDFEGLLTETDFSGRLEHRDSLIISETVQHKRFLGFLWKLPAVKNRQVDAVSKSPYNKINDIVFVVIED